MARKQKQMSAGWQQRPHQMLLYGDCWAPAEELALGSLHQGAQQGTARSAREHSREHREHKEDREHSREHREHKRAQGTHRGRRPVVRDSEVNG